MTVPTLVKVVRSAVLTREIAGAGTDVTVTESLLDVMVPFVAEAMFVTEPASRSAWVIVYDAVHVMLLPGSRVAVAGQLSSVALSSLTVNGPLRVTLPLSIPPRLVSFAWRHKRRPGPGRRSGTRSGARGAGSGQRRTTMASRSTRRLVGPV